MILQYIYVGCASAFAFALTFVGCPVAFSFGVAGYIGLILLKGFWAANSAVCTASFYYFSNYVWTTIPLYVFLGFLAMQAGLTEKFYRGVRLWLGSLKGGLLYSIVLGNAAFGAACGVSIAAATTFAAITLPETRKYSYDDDLTLGVIAASSNLSILIPPSFAFIMYGAITGTPINRLFIAGIIPGMLYAAILCATIAGMVKFRPSLAPRGPKYQIHDKIRGLMEMSGLLGLFVSIIAGLYGGVFTPVEAAGVAVSVVFIAGALLKKFDIEKLSWALRETGFLSAMVFYLVACCSIFNQFLALTGAQSQIQQLLMRMSFSPVEYVVFVSLVFLILGMFFDIGALTILLLPIVFPLTKQLGIDPVYFGVILTSVSNIGTLSPPFGIVVFALSSLMPEFSAQRIFRAVLPFLVTQAVFIILLLLFPDLCLWLPSKMK
ncbi:MAG: TRAP transporter large permease [candidate division WOR-3 bacterium]